MNAADMSNDELHAAFHASADVQERSALLREMTRRREGH